MPWIKTAKDGVVLSIHLTPRASRDAVDGLHGDALKVKIKAPPVDGKANAYLLAFLAEQLGVAKSSVSLERGETSREKTVLVRGKTETDVIRLLGM
jgi:uncharacterized protein (TIGR00251 family)